MVTVRRIEADEGELLRDLRLAALADAPSAFGSTYEDEAARTLDDWAERAEALATAPDRATWFAIDDQGEVLGLVGVWRPEADTSEIDLVSMWTAPVGRRRGVGRLLVDTVLDWARGNGASAVSLWVTRGNDPARRLYESMGFTETGDHQPLPSDPCKDEVRMVRPV